MNIRYEFAGLAVAAILSGCGGGDDDGPAPATAEGSYSGLITKSTIANKFSATVLENGQVWLVYSDDAGDVVGLIQGEGDSKKGTFTSSTRGFVGTGTAVPGKLNATYVKGIQGASLSGTVTEGGGTIEFNGTGTTTFNTPGALSDMAGRWTLSSSTGGAVEFIIDATGGLTTAPTGGCQPVGTFTQRPGTNIFNFELNQGLAPCSLTWKYEGIALYSILANGNRQLIVGAVDSARRYGLAFIGTR